MNHLLEIQEFQQFDNIELIAKEIVEGFITGLHRSPFHGFSVEFAEHRLYNPGEPTKHIDWKLFAKSDRLFIKQYEEETNLRCQLVMDCSSSMLFPFHPTKKNFGLNKLSFSVYSAAALAYLMRRQRDAIGLSLFDEDINFELPAKLSVVHIERLYGQLSSLLQQGGKELLNKQGSTSQILHGIAERVHKRSLIIVFSDLINEDPEEFFQALQHLRYNKHEVVVYHVVDRSKESTLDYDARPHRFVDLESGEEIKLNPNDLKDAFKSETDSYFAELKDRCGKYHIDFIEADIQKDFHQVLWSFLLKRNKLF